MNIVEEVTREALQFFIQWNQAMLDTLDTSRDKEQRLLSAKNILNAETARRELQF